MVSFLKLILTVRVVGIWNMLLEEAIEAGTITLYKSRLNRYMDRIGLVRYRPNADRWDMHKWGRLVGMGFGLRACFLAVYLFVSL